MGSMTDQEKRPLSQSYWVEPECLLAGEYPGQFNEDLTRKRIDALLEAGFDTFIDLTQPNELSPYEGMLKEEARLYKVNVQHLRFPIGDFGLPTPKQMKTILDTIDTSLKKEHKIYLHCWGGIGRTGTTVGCYLVRRGRNGEEAVRQLAEWWKNVPKSCYHPRSPETDGQVDFILKWSGHELNYRK